MKDEFNAPPAVVTYGKAWKAKYFAKLFKMRAADEITEMYTFNYTNLVTLSTACALGVINGSKIVFNLDCSFGTVLFTLHTAYAAVGADLTNLSTLIMAGTLYNYASGVVYKVNNVIGTSLCTKTATETVILIDCITDKFLTYTCRTSLVYDMSKVFILEVCKS